MNSVYYIWKKREKKLILKHHYEFSRAIKKLKHSIRDLHNNCITCYTASNLVTCPLNTSSDILKLWFLFYDNKAIFEGLLYFHAIYKESSLILTPPISMWQTSGGHLQSFMYTCKEVYLYLSQTGILCTSAELKNEFITQLKTKYILQDWPCSRKVAFNQFPTGPWHSLLRYRATQTQNIFLSGWMSVHQTTLPLWLLHNTD